MALRVLRGRAGRGGGALVEEALRGSEAARSRIVDEHWDDAFRVTYLLTHDSGAAEDLAQEALISALGALTTFDRTRPLKPWIQRIAANKAHDWIRRRDRRPEIVHTEVADGAAEVRLADEIADAGPADEIAGALGRLDPRFRVAVVLRYLLELEPTEIADLIGVPVGTVRSRVHRGLTQLYGDLTSKGGAAHEQAR